MTFKEMLTSKITTGSKSGIVFTTPIKSLVPYSSSLQSVNHESIKYFA